MGLEQRVSRNDFLTPDKEFRTFRPHSAKGVAVSIAGEYGLRPQNYRVRGSHIYDARTWHSEDVAEVFYHDPSNPDPDDAPLLFLVSSQGSHSRSFRVSNTRHVQQTLFDRAVAFAEKSYWSLLSLFF